MGVNVDVEAVLKFIQDQLHYLFGGRINARLFTEYIIMFEEVIGEAADGNPIYRPAGLVKLVSDRQIEITSEDGVLTVIKDKPFSFNQVFRYWYAAYTWR